MLKLITNYIKSRLFSRNPYDRLCDLQVALTILEVYSGGIISKQEYDAQHNEISDKINLLYDKFEFLRPDNRQDRCIVTIGDQCYYLD